MEPPCDSPLCHAYTHLCNHASLMHTSMLAIPRPTYTSSGYWTHVGSKPRLPTRKECTHLNCNHRIDKVQPPYCSNTTAKSLLHCMLFMRLFVFVVVWFVCELKQVYAAGPQIPETLIQDKRITIPCLALNAFIIGMKPGTLQTLSKYSKGTPG